MTLPDSQRAFLEQHHDAAMITVARDGTPRSARVAVLLIDGKLWSSGTNDRVRTARLRRDPRCTLFVFAPGWEWLSVETTVRILDGPDAPELNIQLFRLLQDKPTGKLTWFGGEFDEDELLGILRDERRLIYEFDILRAYGITG